MLSLLLALPLAAPAAQSFDPDPEGQAPRWLVVYNQNWPDQNGNGTGDSREVALHYAQRRGVPAANLIGLACSTGSSHVYAGQSGWEAFWDEMVVPLQNAMNLWPENEILGMVFCYGVPYRIEAPFHDPRGLDNCLIALWTLGDRTAPHFVSFGHQDAYFDDAPGFGTDPGRFDPAVHRRQGLRTYLVARLDGVDAEHSKELVDQALYADAYLSAQPGYYGGTGYCDTQYGPYTWAELAGYPFGHLTYGDADKDLAYGRQWMEQAGFPLKWEPYGTEIGEAGATFADGSSAAAAPAALWYQGWYNYCQYFDVWEWRIGSAACDLNSNSIDNFRSPTPGSFLGTALQRGLSCGAGCIAEPYLNGHPYPEVFIYYMVNGYPFAEAARISDPKAKWTQVYIGDPIYQPTRAGKTALLDVQAPPPCAIRATGPTGTPGEWRISTALDSAGFLPELGLLTVHYGPDPAYGAQVQGRDDRPRLFHEAVLSGLSSDELVHYRADYTDPAGNVGLGTPRLFHTALAAQPVLARVYASATITASGSPFTVEGVVGAQAGLASLSSFRVTASAAHLGWNQRDVTKEFTGAGATLTFAADSSTASSRLTVPGGTLSPGDYLLEISAASAAGSDADSLWITVQ